MSYQQKIPFGRVKKPDMEAERKKHRSPNIEAAELILADIEKHGGPESLMVRWAKLVMKKETTGTLWQAEA